jgi:hypothetical protein
MRLDALKLSFMSIFLHFSYIMKKYKLFLVSYSFNYTS